MPFNRLRKRGGRRCTFRLPRLRLYQFPQKKLVAASSREQPDLFRESIALIRGGVIVLELAFEVLVKYQTSGTRSGIPRRP
jgi:hypothetical protein